jgi:hypothetical protein
MTIQVRKNNKSNKNVKFAFGLEEDLDRWDIVECAYCKKKISMFKARLIKNGEYFVCKEHDFITTN